MRHAWAAPEVIDANNTIRRCTKCPTRRITRHEPDNFPPHWTMFAIGDGPQFHSEKVPPCTAPKDAAMEARERNKAKAAKINNEVLAALVDCGLTTELGKAVISAIVRGKVPHTTINY